MTLDESVHGMRLRVIERAQVQGNVSAVCRELGISRTLFYRWRKRLERYGVDGVHPRRQRARAGRPVATAPEVERLVLGIAISAATWGVPTDRGLPGADLAGAPGAQHRAATAAPGWAGHAARAADRARAAGGAHGRVADGTHPATPVACPLRPHAARRGQGAGRATWKSAQSLTRSPAPTATSRAPPRRSV